MKDQVEIDGISYVRETKPGRDTLVVLDNGFVFVGHLTIDDVGKCVLSNVVNVRRWSGAGIGGLSKNSGCATLDNHEDIVFRQHRVVYTSDLMDGWR